MAEVTVWGGRARQEGTVPETPAVSLRLRSPSESFASLWTLNNRVRFLRASRELAAAGTEELQFEHLYGPNVKRATATAFAAVSPANLQGWWVQMLMANETGGQALQWIGRIDREERNVHQSAAGPQGVQVFTAYGPMMILEKVHVHTSRWWRYDDPENPVSGVGVEAAVDWLPSMNAADARGRLVGNRSDEVHGAGQKSCYLFGQRDLWTRLDFIRYILRRYVDESDVSGPTWGITGLTQPLQDLTDRIDFGDSMSVAEMLRRLITPRMGLDFYVRGTWNGNICSGFEVFVFPISTGEQSFGGVTLPAAPNNLEIPIDNEQAVESVRVVRQHERKYRSIRIIGGRVACCLSLRADDFGESNSASDSTQVPTLYPRWSDELEDLYKAGTGNTPDDEKKHDAARRQELLAPVYRRFGVRDGFRWLDAIAIPQVTELGQLTFLQPDEDYQNVQRVTLPELPLLEGYDYSGVVPVNRNLTNREPEQMRLQAWIYQEDVPPPLSFPAGYRPVADFGFSVAPALNDWGVVLDSKVPHRIAKNHWDGAAGSAEQPIVDWRTMIATIAIETNQRLALTWTAPGQNAAVPSEGVLVIEVPDAELWYLTPGTVVDVDAEGNLVTCGDTSRTPLRNDAGRMMMLMAGAIARYGQARASAEVVYGDLKAIADNLGTMLRVIDVGGDTHTINGVVSGVSWDTGFDGRQPRTSIRAGYSL